MIARLAAAALSLSALAACASTPADTPSPSGVPDYRAALVKPCANAADWSPWWLTDAWDDGQIEKSDAQFRADGVMIYAYDGRTYDNGRWSLDGSTLHFDTNNHYADYDGAFDGDGASGVIRNVDGDAGKWTLARDCKP